MTFVTSPDELQHVGKAIGPSGPAGPAQFGPFVIVTTEQHLPHSVDQIRRRFVGRLAGSSLAGFLSGRNGVQVTARVTGRNHVTVFDPQTPLGVSDLDGQTRRPSGSDSGSQFGLPEFIELVFSDRLCHQKAGRVLSSNLHLSVPQ